MRYEYLEKIVLENIRELCNEINIDKWEDILNNYNYKNKSLDKMNEKIKIINSKVEKNKRYLEEMYFDKLSGIITVEMYQKFQKKILDETKYNNDLIEKFKIKEKVLLNNKSKNYHNLIKEFLSFKKPSRSLLASVIDKITVDQNKNIEIYYKIKPIMSDNVIT